MRLYCCHISEDAFECTEKAQWGLIDNGEPPMQEYHSCNNHLHKMVHPEGSQVWKL